MVIYKPYMLELLHEFSGSNITEHIGSDMEDIAWAFKILEAVSTNETEMRLGFSEYGSYMSWVMQKHPESIHINRWKRYGHNQPLIHIFQSFLLFSLIRYYTRFVY